MTKLKFIKTKFHGWRTDLNPFKGYSVDVFQFKTTASNKRMAVKPYFMAFLDGQHFTPKPQEYKQLEEAMNACQKHYDENKED